MKNYALTVAYDGGAFNGWQRQSNAPSVQAVLEDTLARVLGAPVTLHGAGRTDAGVHALGQVCNFRGETRIPAEKLAYVLNRELPPAVQVQASFEVPWGFHARYLARGKHYRYVMRVAPFPSPLWQGRAWQSPYPVEVEAMRRAAEALVGTHDFKAFCASGSSVKSTVRTLYRVDIARKGREIVFDFYGNGFLYNMVRILVGTLVYVGQGRIPAEEVADILAGGDRRAGGITAPAAGLYMVEVFYSRRYIAFLHPVPWPEERTHWSMAPVPKTKKLQLTHACHERSRVFAQKDGKYAKADAEKSIPKRKNRA